MGSLSIWHWLIVLSIVIVVFGTKKLRTAGGDLGEAMKNFKKAMNEGEFVASETRASMSKENMLEPDRQYDASKSVD